MPSANLGIPFVTTSQNQKELTLNDAINALDEAGNGSLAITITTDRTLTDAEFVGNALFKLTGTPASDFNLVIPESQRMFAVRNITGKNCTVKYAASGSLVLADGDDALIHSDGTSIVMLGGGGGGGPVSVALTDLTDGPGTYAGAATYKVVINGAETGFEFVEDTSSSGTDYTARAGATRYVVLDTVAQSSEATVSESRNVVQFNVSGEASNLSATVSGLVSGVDKFTVYQELLFDALPAGEVYAVLLQDPNSGDTLVYLQVNADGSVSVSRDEFYNDDLASSAAGVIVPDTFHKIAASVDAAASGVIKVVVDGVTVITSTTLTARAIGVGDEIRYRVNAFDASDVMTQWSRSAVWSTNHSEALCQSLTTDGSPGTFELPTLRGYWPFDDGSGVVVSAAVGGADLDLSGAGVTWTTHSFSGPAPLYSVVRVDGTPTGDFTGHDDEIAILLSGGWTFLPLVEGIQCYDQTANTETQWDGSVWASISSGGGVWGAITGTLADQTDLSTALSGKATSAQGALADSAVQPADLATVATSGAYADLSGRPPEANDIGLFLGGLPVANTLVLKIVFGRAVTFPANFSGSKLHASVAFTASKVFDLRKNGSSVGSCTVAAAGTTATFTSTGGTAVNCAIGDRFEITTPAVQDATGADVSITMLATRD